MADPQQQLDRDLLLLSEQLAKLRYASEMTTDQFRLWARETMRSADGIKNVSNYYQTTMDNLRYANREQLSESQKLVRQFQNLRIAAREISNRETNAARQIEINREAFDILGRETGQLVMGPLKTFGKALGESASTLAKNMQSGASGIQMAGGLMTSTFGLMTSAGSQVGQSLQKVGTALMLFPNPKTIILGAIVSGIGTATNFLSKSISEVGKIALPLLQAEVEKSHQVFMTMTNSGALFATGIEGMRKAAHDAGLTVSALAAVVKTKSAEIASLGLGLTQGTMKISDVLKVGGLDMQRQLYRLGFTFEEQAALVADVMADMRQAGDARLVPEVVMRNVREYAENVRTLSAITGEDIKKRRDEARSAAAQLAFQSKLASLDEDVRDKVVQSMEAMDAQQRKNFMESVVFGTVINREGAILESLIPAYRQATQASLTAYREGSLNLARQTEINANLGPGITRGMLGLGGTVGVAGMAGVGGLIGNLSTMMGEMVQFFKRFTPSALTGAREGVRGQLDVEGMTADLVQVQVIGNQLAVTFEQKIGPLLGQYTGLLNFLMTKTNELVNFLTNELPKITGAGVQLTRIPAAVLEDLSRPESRAFLEQQIDTKNKQIQSKENDIRSLNIGLEKITAERETEARNRLMERQKGQIAQKQQELNSLQEQLKQLKDVRNSSVTPQSSLPSATTLTEVDVDRLVSVVKTRSLADKTTVSTFATPAERDEFVTVLAQAFDRSFRQSVEPLLTAMEDSTGIARESHRTLVQTYRAVG